MEKDAGTRRYGRIAAAVLVCAASGALSSIALTTSDGQAASAAYYYYCPGGSAGGTYGYCPPTNDPPACSTVVASPNTFWSPNHKLNLVTLSGATDPDGDAVTVTITGVTQDEPVNGLGDGDKAPDAQAGPRSNTVLLRAERSRLGNGRVYRIAFTASDGKGGTCSGTVTVGVPNTQGSGMTAIDSAPPSFNSFGP